MPVGYDTYTNQQMQGQRDRITEILRKSAAPIQPSFDDQMRGALGSYVAARTEGGKPYDVFLEQLDKGRERQIQDMDRNVQAETSIHDIMLKGKQQGDADAAAVYDTAYKLTGGEPNAMNRLLSELDSDPEEITAANILPKAINAASKLGIRNVDWESNKLDLDAKRSKVLERSLESEALRQQMQSGLSPTAYKELEKGKGEMAAAQIQNRIGAQSFKDKVQRVEQLIGEIGTGTGPMEGSDIWQYGARVAGTQTQDKRDQLQALISDLELDVAKMKLKGQGQVTEAERAIAKATLPKLTNNPDANKRILGELTSQADGILGNSRVGTAPTPQQAIEELRRRGKI